jgi:MarR family 2-MHQ and catechol resistance regulon transcriptional repressor
MNVKNIHTYGEEEDLSMKTWIQLFRSFTKIRAKELTYIKSYKLTMMQFQVLEVLYHRGDFNISSITKLTMSTPGNITVVVKNLCKDELILSKKCDKDKRTSFLSITSKGKNVIEEMFPDHAKNFKVYFEVLTYEEKKTMFRLLRKLHKSQ